MEKLAICNQKNLAIKRILQSKLDLWYNINSNNGKFLYELLVHTCIIESVDSISRDEPDSPLT